MANRTAQHTPPAAPPRYKVALVTWAGAYGVNALTWLVLPALTRLFRAWLLAATPAPAQRAQTPAPGSRSWAHAGRAG